jgi:hypothetical protein
MSTVARNIDYSGTYQALTVTQAFGGTMTAYLWGAGGGGGPGDGYSGIGGAGGGGGYSAVTFAVKSGDVVGIAVGQGGTRGVRGRSSGGGPAGASYSSYVWNSLSLTSLSDVARSTNGRYCSFLNQYGVWNGNTYSAYFDRTMAVYFPENGNYEFTGSCDNYADYYVDGVLVLHSPDYTYTSTTTVYVTAGFHNVRLYGVNTGGPASIALTINGYTYSYSGAPGGNAGTSGYSGGGGGGGGATVLTLNGTIIGVAGGGGGGGGGGRFSYIPECNAPGLNVQSASETSGQAGENFSGDGGGGGAGGGGYRGGNGGAGRGYEATGYGGAYGTSYTTSGTTQNPSGRNPGNANDPLRPPAVGVGGAGYIPYPEQSNTDGGSGYAVFEFNIVGSYFNTGSLWQPIRDVFLYHNNQWNVVKNTFMNVNGEWRAVTNSSNNVPQFVSQPSKFGVSYREYTP